jgi:hypothetical protein
VSARSRGAASQALKSRLGGSSERTTLLPSAAAIVSAWSGARGTWRWKIRRYDAEMMKT